MLILFWNFERKLKIMLNLCYLLHLFRTLAITCCSKFQLIRNWCFLKGNSILCRPKMRFKLLLKIITFSKHFSFFFFEFFMDHISQKFSKEHLRYHKEKHFFYYFFKKNEINQKPHLINFKLILMRINQD